MLTILITRDVKVQNYTVSSVPAQRSCGMLCAQRAPAVAKGKIINGDHQLGDFFQNLFDTTDFPARWHCGNWTAFHGWLYIVSDVAIWAAYFAIPLLLYRLLKRRPDIPFHRIFLFFIGFIMLCGLTHLADALIFWWPTYRFSALLRLATAVTSLATVYQIYRIFPSILKLRTLQELQAEIEKRKLTEEMLAAKEFLLSEAGRIACVGGWEVDLVSGIRTWSKSVYDILEIPYDWDIYADTVTSYYPKIYADRLHEAMSKAVNNGESWDLEIKAQTRSGKLIWVRHTGEPVRDEIGDVIKLKGILMNINRYKDHEVQLTSALMVANEKKQQLKNFSYVLSHHIRNHTSNLSALTSMFNKDTLDQENSNILSKARKVTMDLTTTLDDLADVIQARDQIVKQEILDIEAEISGSLGALETGSEIVDINIAFKLESPQVYFSRLYFQNTINQLLSNSIRYRNTCKPLQLIIRSYLTADGRVALEFEDNGLGIDMEKYGSKIFNLYTTFHNLSSTRGVGLYLIKTQLESLGAQISVASIPGSGCRFLVVFRGVAADDLTAIQHR